ncbi:MULTISPECIES: glycosyltransferase [unclassified Thalassospira]|uniref:glycosyltransferase n=1 Tax=unclassified Thalassospira TaxID=2648997 RepID=UPI001B1A5039|nr:glycosyltransferase [Thalassospira sp.]MBO6769743.1 glycosyltransferase family 1 protein [Thalassospira sp.]
MNSAKSLEEVNNIKALYLTFNVKFMDPTRELLLKVLSFSCDLDVYGPGFTSASILSKGIDDYVACNGPYDIIITDEYVLQSFNMEDISSNRFVNHACRFDRSLLIEAVKWREFLSAYQGARVIALMQSDYYNFTNVHIERLQELGDYFITWGEEFIFSKYALESENIPIWGVDADIYSKWEDNYLDFLKQNPQAIISCPQFVARDEGSDLPLHRRSRDWACLGADYNARVIARKILDAEGFQRPGRWMPLAFALASKVGFNMYNKYWTLSAIQGGFRRALRSAKFTYTCGSVLRWPIRKFFEVPVNGSVLVCDKPKGFDCLGFEDRISAVVCRPEEVMDAHWWLSSNLDRAQEIADSGRALVLEQHSVMARSKQIEQAFSLIKDQKFFGSEWVAGQFQLKSM